MIVMGKLQLTYWLSLSFTALLCGCIFPPTDMKLDFSSAVGTYVSTNKYGREILILKSDSTYLYELANSSGETHVNNGRWVGPVKLVSNMPIAALEFRDWPIGIDLYMNSFYSSGNYPLDRKSKIQMAYTIKKQKTKWQYVLQRGVDPSQFDFVKQD